MNTYPEGSNILTAMFDSRADAESAFQRLRAAGIPEANLRLVPGYEGGEPLRTEDEKGFLEKLADFFMPDEDRTVYAEGLRRGGYVVSVIGATDAQYDTAVDILDDEGTIDLDERESAWRAEGWTGGSTSGASVGATGATIGETLDRTGGSASYGSSAASSAGFGSAATRSDLDSEVIPVVEENLRVGKRDLNLGRVRVRSYVVETPISEQVQLRDENVYVERRPVDRAATASDALFAERTIEAEEHTEEAVVSKEARVTEEIALRRESETRTETVADSVRRTEVEIEDDRDVDVRSTGTTDETFRR